MVDPKNYDHLGNYLQDALPEIIGSSEFAIHATDEEMTEHIKGIEYLLYCGNDINTANLIGVDNETILNWHTQEEIDSAIN